MPWGDRTGPMGQGPLTGRKAGYCAGFSAPGFLKLRPGRFPRRGSALGLRRMAWGGLLLGACAVQAFYWATARNKN
jgi:hypothetical protein